MEKHGLHGTLKAGTSYHTKKSSNSPGSKKCIECGEEKPNTNEYFEFRKDTGKTRGLCRACRNKKRKLERYNLKDGHYSVYYLPKEHYCGMTDYLDERMRLHKSRGMNTEGWRVLYCTEDEIDCRYHEALFQSTLGMRGLSQCPE